MPFETVISVPTHMSSPGISSLRRVSEANTTWYDSEASYDDKTRVVPPWSQLAKREGSSPNLRRMRRTSSTTLIPQAKAMQDVSRLPAQRKSLDSTAGAGTPQFGFRRVASSDFLSRTSSVTVASSKAGSSKNTEIGESTTSEPSFMLAVLQGAKMHQLSKCHSADNLVPSILPIRLALNTNLASLLPRSPVLLPWQDCDSPGRNASGNKQDTVVTEAITQKNEFFDKITDEITVHGCQWAEQDDPKILPGAKTSYLMKIATYLGLTRNTPTRSLTMQN